MKKAGISILLLSAACFVFSVFDLYWGISFPSSLSDVSFPYHYKIINSQQAHLALIVLAIVGVRVSIQFLTASNLKSVFTIFTLSYWLSFKFKVLHRD